MDKSTNKEDKQKKKKNKEEKQLDNIDEKSNYKVIKYQEELIKKQMIDIYDLNNKIELNNNVTKIINEIYINYFELFNDTNLNLKNIKNYIKKHTNNCNSNDLENEDENNYNNDLQKKINKISKKTKKILKIVENHVDYTKND